MLPSHKLALAAQMHVLLRRKTGRVTDTEWMVQNADYAREVVRLARLKALEGGHDDLEEQAAKLEAVLLGRPPAGAPVAVPLAPAPMAAFPPGQTALDRLRERQRAQAAGPAPAAPRYVGGLR